MMGRMSLDLGREDSHHADTGSTAECSQKSVEWKNQCLFGVEQVHVPLIQDLFERADVLKNVLFDDSEEFEDRRLQLFNKACGKVLGLLITYPESDCDSWTNRAMVSAMYRLGGKVMEFTHQPGTEDFQDWFHAVESYCDITVLRYSNMAKFYMASAVCRKPLINNGGGFHVEHTIKALSDLYTIKKEQGDMIDNLTIGFVGDLKNDARARNLMVLLSMFKVKLVLVSPSGLTVGPELKAKLMTGIKHSVGIVEIASGGIRPALTECDVIYMSRFFLNDFEDYPVVADEIKRDYALTVDLLINAKSTCTIIHQFPRDETLVPKEIDSFPNAAYVRQFENETLISLALIVSILGLE